MDGFCEKAGFDLEAPSSASRARKATSQATACDYLAVGKSAETGRWGPTWSWNGKPCTAGGARTAAANHPDNQFLVITRGEGVFEACVADDIPLLAGPRNARVALRQVHDRGWQIGVPVAAIPTRARLWPRAACAAAPTQLPEPWPLGGDKDGVTSRHSSVYPWGWGSHVAGVVVRTGRALRAERLAPGRIVMSVRSRLQAAFAAALAAGIALPRRRRVAAAARRRRARRPRSRSRPQPTPTPSTGGGGTGATLRARQGQPSTPSARRRSSRAARRRAHAPWTCWCSRSPQIFDKTDEVGSGHGPVPGPRQGGLPERPRRQPDGGGLLRPARSRRLELRADPGQERERLLRELRRARELRPHAARRQLLRDLHAGARSRWTGATCRPRAAAAATRTRRRSAQHELQAAPARAGLLHARLDGPSSGTTGPTARAIGFTDGRSLCPVRPEDSPERVPCETWRVGYAKDTGPPGPDLDRRRPVLHRARRAAARTTPRTSTRCSSTRRAPIRSARNTGTCCTRGGRAMRSDVLLAVGAALCARGALRRVAAAGAPAPTPRPCRRRRPDSRRRPPTPTPVIALPPGMVCDPTPPPLYGLKREGAHNSGGTRKTLDSRPRGHQREQLLREGRLRLDRQVLLHARRKAIRRPRRATTSRWARSPETGRWGPTWILQRQALYRRRGRGRLHQQPGQPVPGERARRRAVRGLRRGRDPALDRTPTCPARAAARAQSPPVSGECR